MERQFKEYLFQKHLLVSEGSVLEPHSFETLFALANLFNISVKSGKELAQKDMISLAADQLGQRVPDPFYKGFPQSVRELTKDQLLFDQLVHYSVTYGFGNFSEAGHSVFEQTFERMAFKENCEIREFDIISEEEAVKKMAGYVDGLLSSTRPINDTQFGLIRDFITIYRYNIKNCSSKNTAVRLITELRTLKFARFLMLSDVIKLLDMVLYTGYGQEDLRSLNLKNKDRKLISAVIDELFAYSRCDIDTCYEKKDIWCGLLHHIHYRPKCDKAKEFVKAMRSKGNLSAYSAFEKAMNEGDIRGAVKTLKEKKGSGAVLRNLNYIVSRIVKPEDLSFVLESVGTKNNIILMQLLLNYTKDREIERSAGRSFRFIKHGTMRIHDETDEEMSRRRSMLSMGQYKAISIFMDENLRANLKGKLGRVYVDETMKKIALPLQEASSNGGYGVLSKGSRITVPAGKKIRAFTYWEKVDDIDLSVIGMSADGRQTEFSWRTMADKQSDVITFSGDETSGYKGGSEFFDIDIDRFLKKYPDIRYLVFCNNVFSGSNFDKCFCKAGFMMRDLIDSGAVYEPKTVNTSFIIDCPSTFAYLFALDLINREMIWLNVSRAGNTTVAGESRLLFLMDYFDTVKVLNVYRFFEMMASEMTDDPSAADIIVSDRPEFMDVNGNVYGSKELIRSYDHERLLKLMNS
ncbi:MAG: hypothetical protein IJM34_04260 [Lachnospiraceae bacterium]|nr:hypothetical protein [Lachnospiraceae bacterium]